MTFDLTIVHVCRLEQLVYDGMFCLSRISHDAPANAGVKLICYHLFVLTGLLLRQQRPLTAATRRLIPGLGPGAVRSVGPRVLGLVLTGSAPQQGGKVVDWKDSQLRVLAAWASLPPALRLIFRVCVNWGICARQLERTHARTHTPCFKRKRRHRPHTQFLKKTRRQCVDRTILCIGG